MTMSKRSHINWIYIYNGNTQSHSGSWAESFAGNSWGALRCTYTHNTGAFSANHRREAGTWVRSINRWASDHCGKLLTNWVKGEKGWHGRTARLRFRERERGIASSMYQVCGDEVEGSERERWNRFDKLDTSLRALYCSRFIDASWATPETKHRN